MNSMGKLQTSDLDHILAHTENSWRDLKGSRLFFTGGTGLFGVWILESMLEAQKKLNVSFDVTLLSRNPARFLDTYPQFADQKFLKFHQGDITDFKFPEGSFTHVIHGATTSAHATFNKEDELKKFNNVAEGTRRTLEFAEEKAVKDFLLTSSGSACGKQPSNMPLMLEDYHGGPDTMNIHSALGEAKRTAEYLCTVYAHKNNMNMKVARCFSFVGAHLPLDIHYAIGNFIGDGLANRPIAVKGDGAPVRSYLYMADLVIWLMTIFTRGKNLRVYNVGSENGVRIRELAQTVAQCFNPARTVQFAQKPNDAPGTSASDIYVPSTKRAREELGLKEWVDLKDAIKRTIQFHTRN